MFRTEHVLSHGGVLFIVGFCWEKSDPKKLDDDWGIPSGKLTKSYKTWPIWFVDLAMKIYLFSIAMFVYVCLPNRLAWRWLKLKAMDLSDPNFGVGWFGLFQMFDVHSYLTGQSPVDVSPCTWDGSLSMYMSSGIDSKPMKLYKDIFSVKVRWSMMVCMYMCIYI